MKTKLELPIAHHAAPISGMRSPSHHVGELDAEIKRTGRSVCIESSSLLRCDDRWSGSLNPERAYILDLAHATMKLSGFVSRGRKGFRKLESRSCLIKGDSDPEFQKSTSGGGLIYSTVYPPSRSYIPPVIASQSYMRKSLCRNPITLHTSKKPQRHYRSTPALNQSL